MHHDQTRGHLRGRLTALEFIDLGDHIRSADESADMPLTGEVTPGEAFFCPHCGALYAMTHSPRPVGDSNIAKCVVCGSPMDEWKSTTARIYKLVHRPEDA